MSKNGFMSFHEAIFKKQVNRKKDSKIDLEENFKKTFIDIV